jgi:hypothetical protein
VKIRTIQRDYELKNGTKEWDREGSCQTLKIWQIFDLLRVAVDGGGN